MINDPVLQEALAGLLSDLGVGPPRSVTRLPGGRNNRSFRIETDSRTVLLKQYYRDAADPRDRTTTDFRFSRFAWKHGVRDIAEPLAVHPRLGLALFAFVEGRRLSPSEVTLDHVRQALDFVVRLNAHRDAADAATLLSASEAGFSLADHLEAVAARVARLGRAGTQNAPAATAVIARLQAEWARVLQVVGDQRDARPLPQGERCLSPSDFGFHNAILRADQHLIFHDFEYAGWDDPAKLVCDFFSQVEVPVPPHFLEDFTGAFFAALGVAGGHRRRVDLLLPICRVKWCCIVLNDLLPDGERRREFAAVTPDDAARPEAQLHSADRLIDGIAAGLNGLR